MEQDKFSAHLSWEEHLYGADGKVRAVRLKRPVREKVGLILLMRVKCCELQSAKTYGKMNKD